MSPKGLKQNPLNLQGKAADKRLIGFRAGTRKQANLSKQPGVGLCSCYLSTEEAKTEGLL